MQGGGVLGHVGLTSEAVRMMLFGGEWAIRESLTWNFDVSWRGEACWQRCVALSASWNGHARRDDGSALRDKIVGVSGVSAYPILTVTGRWILRRMMMIQKTSVRVS